MCFGADENCRPEPEAPEPLGEPANRAERRARAKKKRKSEAVADNAQTDLAFFRRGAKGFGRPKGGGGKR